MPGDPVPGDHAAQVGPQMAAPAHLITVFHFHLGAEVRGNQSFLHVSRLTAGPVLRIGAPALLLLLLLNAPRLAPIQLAFGHTAIVSRRQHFATLGT